MPPRSPENRKANCYGRRFPIAGTSARSRLLAERLETESAKWPALPDPEKDFDKYQREKLRRARQLHGAAAAAGGMFLEAISGGAFSHDEVLQGLVRHWDYTDGGESNDSHTRTRRNNATFLAISQHWLPQKHPPFQFRQETFNLAQAYADAMRLFADALDATGGNADGAGRTQGGKGRGKKPGINARMLETIQNDTTSMGWSSTQWAKRLRCAKSSVVATQAWKDLAMGRERVKAGRAMDRRRRPKASDRKRE